MRSWKPYCSSRTRVLPCVALAALLAWLAPDRGFAFGEPLPEQSAYTEMLRADRMFKAEDFIGARIAYGAALDLFAALQEQQPDYKPAILRHRMDYCQKQIEALPREEPAPTPEPETAIAPEPDVEIPPPAAPSAESVPATEVEETPPPESAESELSIEKREQDLRRREEALKVSLVGLQLERDRTRESVKQVEAERDLALRMLEDAGKKHKTASVADTERLAELDRKLEEFAQQEVLYRKLQKDHATLREQWAAARERIARLTDESEALRAAQRTEAIPQTEPVPVAAVEPGPVAVAEPAPETVEESVPETEIAEVGAEADAASRNVEMLEIESLIEAGRLEQAAEACRAILKEDPQHVGAGYGLARIDWKTGNRRAARRAAVRLSAAAPDRGDLQFFCGGVFLEENDLRRALGCFEAAVACDAASGPYRKALAEGYVEAGRMEDALAAFCALSELDPGNGPAQYNQAALIVKLGDAERIPEAREAYRKALKLGEPRNAVLDRKLGEGDDE
jgi:tetratricopeptide (TPR) repeat protein